MAEPGFTDDEIRKLREFLPLADSVIEDSAYRDAKKLVWRTWKQAIIALAGLIAACLMLKDQFKAIVKGFSTWLSGA